MSDEELIAWLNRWIEQQVLVLVDSDLLPIRDRIEALTEQLAAAQHDAKEAEAYAEELEAKLAKAVEALGAIVVDDTWGLDHDVYMMCRAALAEIKGESHE